MHARSCAAVVTIALSLGEAGCATGGEAPAEEAIGEAGQAVAGGWDDEATPKANATVSVDGRCTGTLVRPDVVLTAAHCLGNIGQAPSCAPPEPGAPQWQLPGVWYPFVCRAPVSVLFGNDRVGLWARGKSFGAEETFTLRDPRGDGFASGDAISLQSVSGFFLAVESGGGAWVGVDQAAVGSRGRFVVEREIGPGLIRSGQTVYLRFEHRYVTVEGDGLLNVTSTSRSSAGRFMIAAAGGPGVIGAHGPIGLLASNGKWVSAARGGGPWQLRELGTAYNVAWGTDVALIRLRDPVPAAVAKPMDLVHRIPADHLALPRKWGDAFCNGTDLCKTGDFDGDGHDDIMALTRGAAGDVHVGMAGKGQPFIDALWNTGTCTGSQECQTGDFNGDGKDDLVVFLKNTELGAAANDVLVRLSTGASFGSARRWQDDLCGIGQSCAVGDFDGDGKDDLIAFTKINTAFATAGDVRVARNAGDSFGSPERWQSSLCDGNEICKIGDFNGDGRDDIAVFLRDTSTDTGRGDVLVSLSSGKGFGPARLWHNWFCLGSEVCDVGDFDGDGKDDIAAFVRDARTGKGRGDVYVAVSNSEGFGAGRSWNDSFCVGNEVCRTGDFDGDGRTDAVAFTRDTKPGAEAGDVQVSLAGASGSLEDFLSDKELFIAGWGDADAAGEVQERPLLRQAGRVEFARYGGLHDGVNAVQVRPISGAAPGVGDAGGPLAWWDTDKRRFVTLGSNQSVDEASSADYAITFGPGGWDAAHDSRYRSDLGRWVRTALSIKD